MSDRSSAKRVPQLRAISSPERSTSIKARESWHILGIISEFVEAAERLSDIRPAVSIFGSAFWGDLLDWTFAAKTACTAPPQWSLA